jgi:hypothetical protein
MFLIVRSLVYGDWDTRLVMGCPPIRALVIAALLASACSRAPAAPTLETLPPIQTPPLPADVSPVVTSMLVRLATQIVTFHRQNQENLPRNPRLAPYYEEKIAMLASPGLIDGIVHDRRWVEGRAVSTVSSTPIGAVFALESMRQECRDAVDVLEDVVPVLEEFFDTPFPPGSLSVWYGFVVGGTGGGGEINIIDRSMSAAVNAYSDIPYDSVLAHEAAHTYISNEALTQFLEVYAYNVSRGRGVDPLSWEFTRGWGPTTPSPFGVSPLLDIYHRVGYDVMRRAYRAIAPLRPVYGQRLTPAAIAAFAAEVPAEHRAFVEAMLARIIA